MESAVWVEYPLWSFMLGPSNTMLTSASNECGTDLNWQSSSKDPAHGLELNVCLRTMQHMQGEQHHYHYHCPVHGLFQEPNQCPHQKQAPCLYLYFEPVNLEWASSLCFGRVVCILWSDITSSCSILDA